jgi:hypothetical protein
MLFTWDYQNVCVVFRQWQITSPLSLVVTLAAIVALVAGYEALREGIRRYETSVSQRVATSPRECLAACFPIPAYPPFAKSKDPSLPTYPASLC